MKDSGDADKQQEPSFQPNSRKASQTPADFFKEKLAERNKKQVDKNQLKETHIDDVEESPREKLWKRYGDYRGKFWERSITCG